MVGTRTMFTYCVL